MSDPHSILVIDDDDTMLDYCRAVLDSYGFQVSAAGSGKEALKLLESASFSIVLTDHVTVGRGATPILREVRSRQPAARVILMSGIPTLQEASKSYLAGASAYLAKPFTEQQLAEALIQCLPARPSAKAGPPNVPAWFQEMYLDFEDGSRAWLHIERSATGTHLPRLAGDPAPWTCLEFRKCPGCPLRGEPHCPAAVSLQITLDTLRHRRSYDRVRATAVDGRGRSQTVEWSLQEVGATLVQLAVFTSGCPIGKACRPYLEGLPPFVSGQDLARHVLSKILDKHRGDRTRAQAELAETVLRLREVFGQLLLRVRTGGAPPMRDAVPNSIVHLDTLVQMLGVRAESLAQSLADELGWESPESPR